MFGGEVGMFGGEASPSPTGQNPAKGFQVVRLKPVMKQLEVIWAIEEQEGQS